MGAGAMEVGEANIARPSGLDAISERQIFWFVMVLAATIRFFASLPFMVGWYDEIWQYLEPAWHLLEGPWVVTWEYRYGIRSWLLPQIMSGPMALGLALNPDGTTHLWFPRLFAAALSLTVVGCATMLGMRISRVHGLIAGVVSATWFELVFYASRIQAETIAFSVFMAAVWLILGRQKPLNFLLYMIAGCLLSLTVLLRAQYGPMVILFALYVVRLDFQQKWLPVILGGLLGLFADIAANISAGHPPLIWVWESFRIIIIENRVARYSDQPFWAYLGMIGIYWSLVLAPLILMLTRRGIQYYPILFWVALLNLVLHSLISHKEYRFIMASNAIFIILAALTVAELVRQGPRQRFKLILASTLGVWVLGSVVLANGAFKPYWTFLTDLSKVHETAHGAYSEGNSCGFAILAPNSSIAGSYALYRRDRPIYAFDDAETLAKNGQAFNVIITKPQFLMSLPVGYKVNFCGDEGMSDAPVCVAQRRGRCSGNPQEHHVNAWLKRHDN